MRDNLELGKGQLAYKDTDGNLMILPIQDKDVREAFIFRLAKEFNQDPERSAEKLFKKFRDAYEDVVDCNNKDVEKVKL